MTIDQINKEWQKIANLNNPKCRFKKSHGRNIWVVAGRQSGKSFFTQKMIDYYKMI